MFEELKYPTGHFTMPIELTKEILDGWVLKIENFPKRLSLAVKGLTEQQLDTEYRPQGWTIRQVVHHCADSHMNSFIRFKLALTENSPTIKPYFEDKWAELIDSKAFPVNSSLKIIEGLHNRWAALLGNLTEEHLKRVFIHPESKREISLAENIGIYAWHCDHHLAHIESLKKRNDWK